ncbi:MAG: signal peptidase I [Rikenellaceae bacterium]
MFVIAGYFAVRIYIVDQFVIPTGSMQPTLIPGDRVIVNKLIAGARIYDEYDFSEGTPMKSHRTRGLREVRHNDIVIFNFPLNRKRNKIEFELNYVYGKRCVGMPGDSVSIVDGFYRNNNYDGIIGVAEEQQRLSDRPDSLIRKNVLRSMSPNGAVPRWTIKNFGPLYVPRSGDEIAVTRYDLNLYKRLIEFETGEAIQVIDGEIFLGNEPIDKYRFSKNYYFCCGDNVLDSNDSRNWGFVPEEFIVGVVSRITYSRNRETNEFRWDRLMKCVLK